MLGRLGFVGRLSAILMLALLALWAVGAGMSYVAHIPMMPRPGSLPLPHQIAAVVELLDTSDVDRQKTVLSAADSDTLRVTLANAAPAVPSGRRRLKAIEWLVTQYIGESANRDVIAIMPSSDIDDDARAGGRFWRLAHQPLQVAVALKDGRYAVFESQGEFSRRLFGLPPGFWVGALGAVVGIAALFAVWREARPLKELSQAVSRFSGDGQRTPIAPHGAPELKQLIEEVNRMQERIGTLLQARTVLLGAVSHDLKTYITRLKLRVEMIADPDQQTRAERDLDDMTALIEDSLAVARGSSGRDRTSLVDLTGILRKICMDQPHVGLVAPNAPLILEGNVVALCRLFTNIVDNALRYGAKNPKVTAETNGAALRVTVDDDGPGIPPNERELVFEPFYRREPSRSRETGGSGLGLAIAKQIAEQHGGSVGLEQSPSGGLRVIVEFPSGVGRKESTG